MGNHEIMMMLTVVGGPHAHKAETMWLSKRMGGHILLDEMAARGVDAEAAAFARGVVVVAAAADLYAVALSHPPGPPAAPPTPPVALPPPGVVADAATGGGSRAVS